MLSIKLLHCLSATYNYKLSIILKCTVCDPGIKKYSFYNNIINIHFNGRIPGIS